MEFYYIIHYVVYRFYRRHKESCVSSLSYACMIHCVLFFFLIGNIDYFICLWSNVSPTIDKTVAWGYIVLWAFIEYIIFYRNKRYLEIFDEYNRLGDTSEMKLKFKKAKIFNFAMLFINILMFLAVDYCNHHK